MRRALWFVALVILALGVAPKAAAQSGGYTVSVALTYPNDGAGPLDSVRVVYVPSAGALVLHTLPGQPATDAATFAEPAGPVTGTVTVRAFRRGKFTDSPPAAFSFTPDPAPPAPGVTVSTAPTP